MDRWLENDLAAKALAVLIAIILWFSVLNEQNPVTRKTFERVPVTFKGLDTKYQVISVQPRDIDVTLQSPRLLMDMVAREGITAYVDLKGAKAGQQAFPVQISVPYGVQVVEITPSEVSVSIDTISQKKLPVDIRTSGELLPGFKLEATRLQPKEVSVQGARGRLDQVTKAVIDVNLSGVTENTIRHVPVRAIDQANQPVDGIKIEPSEVEVQISVLKVSSVKEALVHVNISGVPAEGFQVGAPSVEPAVVKIEGPAEQLQSINYVNTETVDVTGLKASVAKEISLQIPAGIEVIGQKSVKVTIPIEQK